MVLSLNAAGVLNEPCTTCGSDAQSFKGIFVRGLKELSNALNNQIDVWTCNSTPAQSWSTPAAGATGELHVMNGCATVNNGTGNGTKVVWDTCTNSPQQRWTWRTSGSTLYNAWSGKCMDNTGNATTNGNPIQIWACLNDNAQIWHLP